VYELTKSPLDLGLTGLFQAIPLLGFGMFGGALADALDRRLLINISQSIRFGVVLVLGLLTQLGTVEVWHVYASTLVFTAFGLFDRPARASIIPNVVPRALLFNAIGLQTTGNQMARLTGPALAGGAIATVGLSATYYLVAASALLAVVLMLMMRPVDQHRVGFSALTVTAMALDGMRFLLASPVILGLILLDGALNFFGAFRGVMPILADQVLGVGPQGLGLLLAAPGVGSVLGSLFVTTLGQVAWRGRLVMGTSIIYGVCCLPLAYSPWFPVSLLLGGVLGFCDSIGATVRQTTVQVLTPDRLRGQIGLVASVIGAQAALLAGGILCCVAVLAVGVWWRSSSAAAMTMEAVGDA
jgi:predicted MFS family arabinose efflux permease